MNRLSAGTCSKTAENAELLLQPTHRLKAYQESEGQELDDLGNPPGESYSNPIADRRVKLGFADQPYTGSTRKSEGWFTKPASTLYY